MRKIFVFLAILCLQNCVFAQTDASEKGDKQMELNNFPAAIETFQKALKAKPNSVELSTKLADAYVKLGNFTEAEKVLSKTATAAPNDPNVALRYGKLLKRLGKYDDAKKAFEVFAKNNAAEGEHLAESCDFAKQTIAEPSLYKITNASIINSQYDEFGASLIGEKLVYSSGRMDMQRKNSKMPVGSNQLFVSDLDKGTPASKAFYKSDLKNTYNDGPIAAAANGKVVAVTHNNIINGINALQQNGLELSLAIAEVNPNGEWNSPKAFSQNIFGYATGFACFAADGNTIYFSSDRPGGFGGFDIYMSKKAGETWSKPVNLGDVVNTVGNEIFPHVTGSNLYFSSDFHQGLGGYDVFKAAKTGDDYKVIYHLGNGINSSADDFGYVYDEKTNHGFLTSNREGGKGGTDIYTVTKESNEITIHVKTTENQGIDAAKIDMSKCSETAFNTDDKGTYSFQTAPNFTCEAVISKIGYISQTVNLSSAKKNYDITLKKELPTLAGFVKNSKNEPLADVVVKATNTANNETLEALSLANGEYNLALVEGNAYNMVYSKPGFVNLQSKVKVEKGKASLGTLTLLDVGEPYIPTAMNSDNGTATRKGGVKKPTKGFAIQLASVSGNKVDLKAYDNIKSLGNIYTTFLDNSNITKVKLGTFEKREEAVKLLDAIKAQGYVQAFVVEEKESTTPVIPKPTDVKDPKEKVLERRVAIPIATQYKVRIATLTDASKFDPKALARVATVDQIKNGDKTIIVLTNFNSLDEAKNARDQAIQMGFKDAHVVLPKEGKLSKVE